MYGVPPQTMKYICMIDRHCLMMFMTLQIDQFPAENMLLVDSYDKVYET
jgi:hypothetical protein